MIYASFENFFWDKPFLFFMCVNGVILMCIPEVEMMSILDLSVVVGHHGGICTAQKFLQCDFYWLNIYKVAHDYAQAGDQWQWKGNISWKNEVPMEPILRV